MLLYFEKTYLLLYVIMGLIVFVYKSYSITFPPNTMGPEVAAFVIFGVICYYRVDMGSMGNKGESLSALTWFLLISLPAIIGAVFFARL
jgi:hypothetical protein